MPRLLRERRLIESGRAGVAAARHVVFAAAHVRDRYHELVAVPMDRTVLVPQGLYRPVEPRRGKALRARLRLPEGATLAIGLGYGDLRKGFDLFLQAWRLAQGVDASIHMLWVGDLDPVISAYLGAELAAAAATGTFHHLPFQSDGADWLAAADVHLLTSREDPFPSVVLEAMSAGVPTVAFEEAGSAPDVLRELRAGVSVPLGDAAAMVRQMRALALQTEREDRLRLTALARERFPFGAYAETLLAMAMPARASISAIVPTLNYARYLPGRLASIFEQSVAPIEILVLDDGSTDGSEAVVRTTAAKAGREVRWVRAAQRIGVFAQWRRAASLATGEFVWIAEADDLADAALLERLGQALLDAPDARFAFADSAAIDAGGDALWPDHKAYYREAGTLLLERSGVIAADEFLREVIGTRNLVLNASAVLWRREALIEALERAGEALDGFRLAGDWLLYAEAASAGRVGRLCGRTIEPASAASAGRDRGARPVDTSRRNQADASSGAGDPRRSARPRCGTTPRGCSRAALAQISVGLGTSGSGRQGIRGGAAAGVVAVVDLLLASQLALTGALGIALAGQVMANGAAADGADDPVMSRGVTGDPADHGAAEATHGVSLRGGQQGDAQRGSG